MGYKDLGYESYDHYLMSHWFRDLTEELIYSDPETACFICTKKIPDLLFGQYLLLHHTDYSKLGREKFGRDIFVLCNSCHEEAHFKNILFFFRRKIKLTKKNLLRRVYYLKIKSCIRNRRIGLLLLHFPRYLAAL